MTKNRWALIALIALLHFSCGNSNSGDAPTQVDDQVEEDASPDMGDTEAIDMMVDDMNRATNMSLTTRADVSIDGMTGTVALSKQGQTVRKMTYKGAGENQNTERNIYLTPEEKPRFFQDITVRQSCDDGNPCVQETKVYFDQDGNAIAAFTRTARNTMSTAALNNAEFSEVYDYDRYNNMVVDQIAAMKNSGPTETNAGAETPQTTEAKSTEEQQQPSRTSRPRMDRIAFRPGATAQVSGSIQGSGTKQYITELPGEMALTFRLLTDNSAARIMVTDEQGKRLSVAGQELSYTPPSAGDYLIKVFMNMGDASSQQKADYRLQIRQAQ